jgi:enediyne biosynthesis protein E4
MTRKLILKQNYRSNSHENKSLFLLFIFLLLLSGCHSGNKPSNISTGKINSSIPPDNGEFFQEIGQEIGIKCVHSIGEKDLNNIIESVGGGAAFLDYDQDGFIDLYVCSGTWLKGFSKGEKPEIMPHNHLYRNRGDGTFEDVTEKAGVGGPWYSMGVSVGDFNNDGYPDIYLSNYGPNVLLKNNGDGTFSDVTKRANVGGGDKCSIGGVWLDYDNDGFLDLYVGNYLKFDPNYKYYYAPDGFPGPMAYESEEDVLYHNKGDGTFEDVTKAMGIVDVDGRAMGVGAADIDGDGFVVIFVANDHTLNYLWHNEGGKKFVNWGTRSGTAFSQAGEATVSMCVDFADYNHDGLIDIFKTDDSYCSLYENKGNGIFTDVSVSSGIATANAQFVGWTGSFFDYDNDGNIDIFKTNGALKHLYGEEDQIFRNEGNGKFKDVSLELGSYFKKEMVGRGACLGDYNNDGNIDIYIVNLNDQGIFLRNNKGNRNSWLELNLIGTTSNRDAIGASVKVTSGGVTQVAQKKSASGYLSQNDPRMHFGLDKNQLIDKIEITWPSRKSQILENIKVNQILSVKEPK